MYRYIIYSVSAQLLLVSLYICNSQCYGSFTIETLDTNRGLNIESIISVIKNDSVFEFISAHKLASLFIFKLNGVTVFKNIPRFKFYNKVFTIGLQNQIHHLVNSLILQKDTLYFEGFSPLFPSGNYYMGNDSIVAMGDKYYNCVILKGFSNAINSWHISSKIFSIILEKRYLFPVYVNVLNEDRRKSYFLRPLQIVIP